MISKNGPLGCDRGGIQGLYSYFIRKCQKIAAPDAPDSSKTFFKSPGPYLNRQKKHDFLRSVLAPLNQDSGAQDIDFCVTSKGGSRWWWEIHFSCACIGWFLAARAFLINAFRITYVKHSTKKTSIIYLSVFCLQVTLDWAHTRSLCNLSLHHVHRSLEFRLVYVHKDCKFVSVLRCLSGKKQFFINQIALGTRPPPGKCAWVLTFDRDNCFLWRLCDVPAPQRPHIRFTTPNLAFSRLTSEWLCCSKSWCSRLDLKFGLPSWLMFCNCWSGHGRLMCCLGLAASVLSLLEPGVNPWTVGSRAYALLGSEKDVAFRNSYQS